MWNHRNSVRFDYFFFLGGAPPLTLLPCPLSPQKACHSLEPLSSIIQLHNWNTARSKVRRPCTRTILHTTTYLLPHIIWRGSKHCQITYITFRTTNNICII